jgi:hypothetical protein
MGKWAILAGGAALAAAALAVMLRARIRQHDPGHVEHPGLEVEFDPRQGFGFVILVRHVRRVDRPVWKLETAELIGWPEAAIAHAPPGRTDEPPPQALSRRARIGRTLPAVAAFAADVVLVGRASGSMAEPPAGASLLLQLRRADGTRWACRAPLEAVAAAA